MITEEQKKQIEQFSDHCLKIGLSTEPIDKSKNQEYIDYIYKEFLNLDAPYIWYCDSPLQYNFIINIINNSNYYELNDDVRQEVMSKISDNIDENIKKYIHKEDSIFHNIYWSNLDIYSISFYLFPRLFLGEDYNEKNNKSLDIFYKLFQNCGCLFFHKDICFITERPLQINRKDTRLHNENGPSVSYKDGYSLWHMNGVAMPKDIILKDAKDITIEDYLNNNNVEVRQEILNKIGLERFAEICNQKSLEKINGLKLYSKYSITNYHQHGDVTLSPKNKKEVCFDNLSDSMKDRLQNIDYELLGLDLVNCKSKALKMSNASHTNEVHIEFVNDNCQNVFNAIKFRNEQDSLPYELS